MTQNPYWNHKPKEALFLELYILDIESMLKARRVNYLHYQATQKSEDMLYKVFTNQWRQPTEWDWTLQSRLDLADLGMEEDLEWIKQKSKQSFKNLVKVKVK